MQKKSLNDLVKRIASLSLYLFLPDIYSLRPNLNQDQSNPTLYSHFQLVIGSLLYIMLGIRPDIAFMVIKMSQFSSNPIELNICKRHSILCTIFHPFRIFAFCTLDMVTRTVYVLILIQIGLVTLKHHVPPLVMPSS